MYLNYFGLKEPGFSITPDPEYLFLSEQHREALAHLLYGAGESGGFVLLTGEVGTGKTTVCRALLDQLPGEVEVALVLNPAVSGRGLLRTICNEFQIPIQGAESSAKQLIDRLNLYLLEAHARGRRPVLLIDEAQVLRPAVLELVRLLTNLETNKHKLLQIFLVGQPELRRLIDSDALRQLSQRITARCHLGPLKARETAAYIRHRLAVAGVDRPLFTRRAVRRIHALSGGVPRLINILCDRALLGACVSRDLQVKVRTVARAARELRGEPAGRRPWQARPAFTAALLVATGVAIGWSALEWVGEGGDQDLGRWLVAQLGGTRATEPEKEPERGSTRPNTLSSPELPDELAAKPEADTKAMSRVALASSPEPAATQPPPPGGAESEAVSPVSEAPPPGPEAANANPQPPAPPAVDENPPADPVEPLSAVPLMNRTQALAVLLRRWGVESQDLGSRANPCVRINGFGLRCEQEEGTWGNLRFFDRPALLELIGEGPQRFAVLGVLADEVATLDLGEGGAQVRLADLDERWSGRYLLVWQPPPFGTTVIGPGSSREATEWLRALLVQVPGLGFSALDGRQFDAELSAAVRRFQRGRGLAEDGVAGYRTLIQLHNAVAMPAIPKLVEVP